MKKDLLQQVLLQEKKDDWGYIYYCATKEVNWGNIYILMCLWVFFFFFCNSNLNLLHQFKIVARITYYI